MNGGDEQRKAALRKLAASGALRQLEAWREIESAVVSAISDCASVAPSEIKFLLAHGMLQGVVLDSLVKLADGR